MAPFQSTTLCSKHISCDDRTKRRDARCVASLRVRKVVGHPIYIQTLSQTHKCIHTSRKYTTRRLSPIDRVPKTPARDVKICKSPGPGDAGVGPGPLALFLMVSRAGKDREKSLTQTVVYALSGGGRRRAGWREAERRDLLKEAPACAVKHRAREARHHPGRGARACRESGTTTRWRAGHTELFLGHKSGSQQL